MDGEVCPRAVCAGTGRRGWRPVARRRRPSSSPVAASFDGRCRAGGLRPATRRWTFPRGTCINTGMQKHVARALFLFTGFFALQASALRAIPCDMRGHHSPGTRIVGLQDGISVVSGAMNDMPMPGDQADNGREMIMTEASEPWSHTAPGDGSCDHTTAPQDCTAMTVCSAVFVSSGSVDPHEAGSPQFVAATAVGVPSSRAIEPDLPPPRA